MWLLQLDGAPVLILSLWSPLVVRGCTWGNLVSQRPHLAPRTPTPRLGAGVAFAAQQIWLPGWAELLW